jgi:gluconolactonase
VLADRFDGTPSNSPNDAVVHLDGGNWFADPAYGTQSVGRYEGNYGEILLGHAVYRMGRSGTPHVTDGLTTPHGLCFSPDYTKLDIFAAGEGAGDITRFDVIDETRLANARLCTDIVIDGEGRSGCRSRRHRWEHPDIRRLGRSRLRRHPVLRPGRRTDRARSSP